MIARRIKNNRGFTLVETVLYSALIAATIGAVLAVTYQIIQGSGSISGKIAAGGEAGFVIAKIEWALGGASVIQVPASGASSSTLSLILVDYPKNPVIFSASSGTVYLAQGGGVPVPLTSSRAAITGLTFTHIPSNGKQPDGVDVSFSAGGNQYHTSFFLRK